MCGWAFLGPIGSWWVRLVQGWSSWALLGQMWAWRVRLGPGGSDWSLVGQGGLLARVSCEGYGPTLVWVSSHQLRHGGHGSEWESVAQCR